MNCSTWSWEDRFIYLNLSIKSFFLSRLFFSHDIHESQDCRGSGMAFLLSLFHFNLLHEHFDIRRTVNAESSPLYVHSSWHTRIGKSWFLNAIRQPLYKSKENLTNTLHIWILANKYHNERVTIWDVA